MSEVDETWLYSAMRGIGAAVAHGSFRTLTISKSAEAG